MLRNGDYSDMLDHEWAGTREYHDFFCPFPIVNEKLIETLPEVPAEESPKSNTEQTHVHTKKRKRAPSNKDKKELAPEVKLANQKREKAWKQQYIFEDDYIAGKSIQESLVPHNSYSKIEGRAGDTKIAEKYRDKLIDGRLIITVEHAYFKYNEKNKYVFKLTGQPIPQVRITRAVQNHKLVDGKEIIRHSSLMKRKAFIEYGEEKKVRELDKKEKKNLKYDEKDQCYYFAFESNKYTVIFGKEIYLAPHSLPITPEVNSLTAETPNASINQKPTHPKKRKRPINNKDEADQYRYSKDKTASALNERPIAPSFPFFSATTFLQYQANAVQQANYNPYNNFSSNPHILFQAARPQITSPANRQHIIPDVLPISSIMMNKKPT